MLIDFAYLNPKSTNTKKEILIMIIVNLAGALLIALIAWWFWFYKSKSSTKLDDKLVVHVEDGVYQPARIKLDSGRATTIQFVRKDASPCSATLEFPDLNIIEELPLNSTKVIALPALQPGEYAFHCQMQMYRGLLLVE